MEERIYKIINEKEMVREILEKGIEGWSSEEIQGGTLYRFILRDGTYKEAVNISRNNLKKLQIEEWSKF